MAQRFDIHIQTLPEADQRSTFKFMSFGFVDTVGVKGFQMLLNQWLKCFLTRRGTDPTALDYGTNFSALIASEVPLSDARDVVVLSIDQCNEQVQVFNRRDVTLTPSERLASGQLINFVEKPSDPGFEAYIEIKNQANERLTFNLPSVSTTV